jgi:hypothetical protein
VVAHRDDAVAILGRLLQLAVLFGRIEPGPRRQGILLRDRNGGSFISIRFSGRVSAVDCLVEVAERCVESREVQAPNDVGGW